MARLTALALVLSGLCATQAPAQTDISDMIATEGLARAEDYLAALPSPTPSDVFALGGVRFLGGIETALQARWRIGLVSERLRLVGLPFLRLPIAPNPSPDVFRPEMIDAIFAGTSADMAEAAETLAGVEGEVALTIDLDDLWFDVNADGSREPGESVLDIAGFMLGGGEPAGAMTIRFDTADVAWLRAYAHLLAGLSDTIRAIGPTDPIARVMDTARAFEAIDGPPRPSQPYSIAEYRDEIDQIAAVILALEQTPDADLSQAAHAHFLAMIADNREFWALVARETDNEAEWIPNKNQTAALGLPFPSETGTSWLAVLADAEKVLNGALLIPYWRLGPGAGLDLGAMFMEPPALDPVGLIQGETLLPYARKGPLANMDALRRFEALIGGNAALYMVMLN